MGYAHIDNLYREQSILLFKECYALEKIHGTSAHVRWADGQVHFHNGGEKRERFVALFGEAALKACFEAIGHPTVIVYGEAYGGSQQGMSHRYGKALRFVAFEVQIGDKWLAVPQAADVVAKLGLEFVHYEKVPTDLDSLNAQRDAASTQAQRNGVEGFQPREGVVLRPLIEVTRNDGARIMAKHKRDDERETKTPREVVDPNKQAVLTQAAAIADEWVTPTRLEHVLSHLTVDGLVPNVERTRDVISAMIEDVVREGAGEIVDSREARAAIGRKAAELFHAKLKQALKKPNHA